MTNLEFKEKLDETLHELEKAKGHLGKEDYAHMLESVFDARRLLHDVAVDLRDGVLKCNSG